MAYHKISYATDPNIGFQINQFERIYTSHYGVPQDFLRIRPQYRVTNQNFHSSLSTVANLRMQSVPMDTTVSQRHILQTQGRSPGKIFKNQGIYAIFASKIKIPGQDPTFYYHRVVNTPRIHIFQYSKLSTLRIYPYKSHKQRALRVAHAQTNHLFQPISSALVKQVAPHFPAR